MTTVPVQRAPEPESGDARGAGPCHHVTNQKLTEAWGAPPAERQRLIDEVIVGNVDLARSVARRYSKRGVPIEDLEQVACVALVRAANRFDPTKADDFRTYAVPSIRGEVTRYFRDQAWMVRPVRRVQEVQALIQRETTRTDGRPPNPVEVAERLGLDAEDVREAMGAQGCFHAKSLDAPLPDGEQTFGDMLADDFSEHEAAEARVMLRALVKDLPSRDRLILYLRFFEGRTQSEIGEEIGVTQMQVSRLLTRILTQMRERAHDVFDDPGAETERSRGGGQGAA
jgi:RNA polymerase sigma-B factor